MAENLNISSVSGGYKSQSQLLVEAFKKTEQPKVDAILQKKQTLEKTREFFNSLFTKVSALNSSTDKFIGIDPKSKFKTRKITASDNSVLSVSASSNAIIGINSIKVLRLASYDILVSDRIDLSQNAESLFNGKNKLKPGTYSFKIASENKDLIEYTIELTGNETNEEIMTKIVNTINNNDNSTITASIVKDTETTGRLS